MRLSSYLTRLIWLCVLPLLVFSVWLAIDHVRTLQLRNDQEAIHIARNVATAIDHHLNARIGSLRVMAASPLADDPTLWPLYYKVSQGYLKNFRSHVIFAEANEPRQMLFSTRMPFGALLPLLPMPKGRAAVPQAVATGQPAVGDIFVGPIAGETLVAVAVPVSRDEKVVKVLLATFELRLFQERLEQVALPAGWGLSLLDSQGEVIARRQAGGNGDHPPETVHRRNVVNLTAAPWSVALEIPDAIYLAPLMSAGLSLGLGVLAVVLIGIGGSFWVARRLGRAVASLAEPNHRPVAGLEVAEIASARRLIEAGKRRIASFAAAQNEAIEQERRRVAREVHDQLGQIFTALKMIVQSLPRDVFPPGQEAAMHRALKVGIASAHKIAADLRPPLLDDLGLADALEYFGSEVAAASQIECAIAVVDHTRLCPAQALGLFRIVQEAVTNSLRYAAASRIDIAGSSDGDCYRLGITDNGCGFDPATVRPGAMGLANMRERAALMNGSCCILSRPGGGTTVAITLPLDEKEDHAHHESPAA